MRTERNAKTAPPQKWPAPAYSGGTHSLTLAPTIDRKNVLAAMAEMVRHQLLDCRELPEELGLPLAEYCENATAI